MKVRCYLRIAKHGYKYKVAANIKSSEEPLKITGSYGKQEQLLPTVGFAVDFNIPDDLFSRASKVIAEIDIATKNAVILGEVPIIGELKKDKKIN